jgi:hypothetical protein
MLRGILVSDYAEKLFGKSMTVRTYSVNESMKNSFWILSLPLKISY